MACALKYGKKKKMKKKNGFKTSKKYAKTTGKGIKKFHKAASKIKI